MTGAGTVATGENATFAIDGSSQKDLNGRIVNHSGTAIWTGSGNILARDGAVFNNLAGAVFEAQNNQSYYWNFNGSVPVFNNAGMLRKTGGTGLSIFDASMTHSGSLEALSGTIRLARSFTQSAGSTTMNGGNIETLPGMTINGGTLQGAGSITGNVTMNSGSAIPGNSAGVMSINGDYIQGAGATLQFEIGGTTQGGQFDHLSIAGTATLGGALRISRINDFVPSPSDTFEIITANSATGAFASITGTDAANGNFFDPVYDAGNVMLVLKDGSPSISSMNFTYNAGQFSFQITGIAEQTYRVEGTQDFVTWTDIETRLTTATTWDFVDPNPDKLTYRFYRTVFLPQ